MRSIRLYSNFERLLGQFDGNNIAILDDLVAHNPASLELLLYLTALAEHGEVTKQIAATALLKGYQAAGVSFPAAIVRRLLELLSAVTHWKSQLHLLQMLPELHIPRGYADFLCESLLDCLSSRNKFIRAWAYGGLYHLASVYDEYHEEVTALLERAGREEAPSVRARLRQLAPLDSSNTQRRKRA